MLTFIRRNSDGAADSVISMCKLKSVEYQALRLIVDLLQGAVDAGNLDRSQDSIFTQFVKEFKTFSRNISEGSHPETFYIDLFSTAFTLIAKKSIKDKEMYQDLLFSDTVKFLALVLKTNEEKNSGKRYVGQIDLESQLFVDVAPQIVEETFSKPTVAKAEPEVAAKPKKEESKASKGKGRAKAAPATEKAKPVAAAATE